jgi:DMSO/TMAO reductase YedYZ heme-binding membrane subunit
MPFRLSPAAQMLPFLLRYRRLLGVIAFLAVLWTVFEMTGLRQHLNLAYVRDELLSHPQIGLLVFVLPRDVFADSLAGR